MGRAGWRRQGCGNDGMGSGRPGWLGSHGRIGELDVVGGGRGNGTPGSGPPPPPGVGLLGVGLLGVGLLGVGLAEDGTRLRPGAAVGVEA
jgi:hypothetical protein